MHVKAIELLLICGGAWLALWVNRMLNTVQPLNKVITVLIIVVAIFLILQSLGLVNTGTSVSLR